MSIRTLYAVAVRADLTFKTNGGIVTGERIIQSGALVAETDEEAVRLARLAAAKRYPNIRYEHIKVHVSKVPNDMLRELVAGLATTPEPNALTDVDTPLNA